MLLSAQHRLAGRFAADDAGIATSEAEHKLGPFWRSDEALAAIDAFAERAGRRSSA